MEKDNQLKTYSNSAPYDVQSKYANHTKLDFEVREPNFNQTKVKHKKIRSIQDPIHGIIVLEDPIQ